MPRLWVVLLLAGCGTPPVEGALGDFVVRVDPDRGRFSVRTSGGTVLLDGLPGDNAGGDGYATLSSRTAQASIEEQFGAFNISETAPPPWTPARNFSGIVVAVDHISFDIAGGAHATITPDGARLRIQLTAPAGANRISAAFACAADEHFLGIGAQTQEIDHRGQTVPLWISEQGIGRQISSDDPPGDWFYTGVRHQTYYDVPFFVDSHGFALLSESSRRHIYAFCSERSDAWRVESWEGQLNLVLFAGKPIDALNAYRDYVGRPAPPPAWTFAPWNDALFGSANLRRVANLLRTNHIPSSVIWTEDWAGASQSGDRYNLTYNWDVDRTLYPDVETLSGDLHTAGFRFLSYFNTFVPSTGDQYAEGIANGYTIKQSDGTPYLFTGVDFKPASLVDLSNPAARDWMAMAMRRALGYGFDGWMADYGEWLPADAQLASGEDAQAAHNTYPVAWQKLNESVLGNDALAFVRSGWHGSQAVGHRVVWGGDQTTDFDLGDGLPTVIPIAAGLASVGEPWFGCDIGGYFSDSAHLPATRELWWRWVTLGAFMPIMRTHHGLVTTKNYNIETAPDGMAHYARWAGVHMALYPYFASLAATGDSMVRPLPLIYPDQPEAWPILDEYMLGPSLLVAPVVSEGALTRQVWLPPGTWLRVFSPAGGAPSDGPAMVDAAADLGEIPVYAPAGTLFELLPPSVETLVTPAPAGLGLVDAGDNRSLLAVLGGNAAVTSGARSYSLQSSAGAQPASFTWKSAALPSCSGNPAPCGDVDTSARSFTGSLIGSGTLAGSDGSQVTITSSTTAMTTITARW